jgi:hypothetical protein
LFPRRYYSNETPLNLWQWMEEIWRKNGFPVPVKQYHPVSVKLQRYSQAGVTIK